MILNYEAKFGDYNQFTQYSVGKKDRREQTEQEDLAVASIAQDDPSTLPGDDTFPRARMHRDRNAR